MSARAVHIVWDAVPATAAAPGIERQVVHGDGLTLVRVRLARGAVLPRHEHPHAQCTTVLAGRLRVAVDGAPAAEAGPGETVAIPGGVAHEVEAVTDVLALETFVPEREDLPAS